MCGLKVEAEFEVELWNLILLSRVEFVCEEDVVEEEEHNRTKAEFYSPADANDQEAPWQEVNAALRQPPSRYTIARSGMCRLAGCGYLDLHAGR